MLFKRATIEFEKKITVRVIFPESFTREQIEEAAESELEIIDTYYDAAQWNAYVCNVKQIDVPAEDCRIITFTENGRLKRRIASEVFRDPMILVKGDDENFSDPIDATWWQVDDEQLAALKEKERRLQDINHPDQIALPIAPKGSAA